MTSNMKPLNDRLAKAQREISKAIQKQGKAAADAGEGDKALYRALQAVRELGDIMNGDEDLQKTFLSGHEYSDSKGNTKKVIFNKPVQKNIYVGLLKLAFSGTGKSSLSQYAKALKLSEKDEKDSAKFVDWLDGEHKCTDGNHGGIKGAIKRAKVELLTPQERKAQAVKTKTDYELAHKSFLGNATKIKAPQISQFNGTAKVLVHYDQEMGILYVDEINAATDERSISSAVHAWKSKKN